MKRLCFVLLLFIFLSNTLAQEPAVEIRAVWLTTNWKLDWPKKGKTVEEQKKELIDILDELKKSKINLVLFQARAQGKVFYNSMLERKSPFFNHANNFDPLAFAITECHARGMECHAWITAIPVEKVRLSKRGTVLEKKPDFYKRVNTYWHLDPGRPETKSRLVLIAKEIATKYDVDGIHLDYIRYPDHSKDFADQDTYRLYGKGQNKDQWRRNNITSIVSEIYDAVKAIKPWVQVSSAPLGKYKPIGKLDNWTAYESVYQDVAQWLSIDKQDIIFPMMYNDGHEFYPHIDSWLDISNGRPVVPGLGVYKMEAKEKNWGVKTVIDQIDFTRKKDTKGQAYFRAEQVLENTKGLRHYINKLYKYPAKLPPMTWLSNREPDSPNDLRVYKDENGVLNIEWQKAMTDDKCTYNIYYSETEILDVNDAETILEANIYNNSYRLPASVGEYGFFYFVTASDRYHNESMPAESVYFVHSDKIY